ncbi:Multifunctional conjugation protein TraI [Aquisphaera giovannonii]|uniref:Multifunctional conjugation protein TraI n=1 Tax=Aquisphaera giovannonii TaxID=406548 RepID=A0A5B9W7J3_9BACT|nr:Multifunctional conjugation protein TraI [Aquisphaera giovannonii]
MLRTHWLTSPAAAKAYYKSADYYAATPGEWLGRGAEMLGLQGPANYADFEKLCDNLDPRTGELLRPHARDDGRVGMDLTFNSTKSVGIARELAGAGNAGDPRIEEAHRDAVRYAMSFVEADMQGRVRVGGKNEDRTTGNMVACRFTHRDTRISADDGRPDMSLHDHVFVLNTTHDPVEGKWKAAQMGQIKHDAPYYEAIYHNRLASNLRELGYGIRRKDKAFEIEGISDDLVKKFSRRREYIKAVAAKLGITTPEGMDKLGATTRLGKAKELADDLNGYYVSRLTGKERQELASLKGRPSYQSNEQEAVRYAIGHLFERKSVVEERRLYEAAIRHGIGSVTPEGVKAEARQQGLLVKAGEATTREVLAEEERVVAFAREGRGTCRPMGMSAAPPRTQPTGQFQSIAGQRATSLPQSNPSHLATASSSAQPKPAISDLSPEQAAIARHVWDSPDRVILIRGAAGTGKTHTMKATIAGIDRPVVVLAPSADASRGVLRKEGFEEADTVARFLIDERYREQARGGVIWVDEAGLLGIRQVRAVFDAAEELGARVVLQGDRKQHGSVERGATLRVLEQFAGLPVAELKDIRRQRGRYKDAVASLAKGDILAGYDTLDSLGWVKEAQGSKPLVDEYMAALDAGRSVLVVAPTHAEGDGITKEIRSRLKERGIVREDERDFKTLAPLHWTDAEKGDLERFVGTETLQFHRNSGTFKAGDRVRVADIKRGSSYKSPSHFSVYQERRCALAVGDTIRITANGKTADGKHKLNNGSVYSVAGFTEQGDILLGNGWTVAADYGHLAHGYVATSHASQGKTVDRVLIAMGRQSRPAINAEQFYVSVSRGRESATIYSDAPREELRADIQRSDPRKSATELLGRPKPRPRKRDRLRTLTERVKTAFKQLREKAVDVMGIVREKERDYARAR